MAITTVEDARAANQAAGEHFFDNDARGGLGLRALGPVYPTTQGAFIVFSMRRDRTQPRTYGIRYLSEATGRLHRVDNNPGRKAPVNAHNVAANLAATWQHGCQICRNVGHEPHEPCKE